MQIKSPSSSTSTTIKTLINNFITHPVYRFVVRSLNKARSVILRRDHNSKDRSLVMMFYPRNASNEQSKIPFGSFRLHYNWFSSHLVPAPHPPEHGSLFGEVISNDIDGDREYRLSGYLEWLDDTVSEDYVNGDYNENDLGDDIDRLADEFIASCHEKFLLEKVESFRRFQEMLARSL